MKCWMTCCSTGRRIRPESRSPPHGGLRMQRLRLLASQIRVARGALERQGGYQRDGASGRSSFAKAWSLSGPTRSRRSASQSSARTVTLDALTGSPRLQAVQAAGCGGSAVVNVTRPVGPS